MAVTDLLVIAVVSIVNALIVESISFFLIYNTPSYVVQKTSIDKNKKKLEKKKMEPPSKANLKQIERLEEMIKTGGQTMFMASVKSKMCVTVSLVLLFAILNSVFDGKVVARLPFEPFGLVHRMSHRNLIGEDYTECAFLFFYVLCNMSISSNVKKWLNLTPEDAQAPNPFAPQ